MRFRLNKIELKGYKSISPEGQTIPLNDDVTVLIGSNGVGKSNVVSFFQLLSYAMSGSLQNYIGENGFADAFLYYVEETVESITGSGTVILHNDYMPVVPVITTTAETTLRWAIDGESFHKTVSAGTWEIPELELRHGDNTVSVTGEGTTTFTYRQGRL